MSKAPSLSIVIPSLNEASRLPLLLADLHLWPTPMQLLVVDGGSTDQTKLCAQLAGAELMQTLKPGRGQQLAVGARASRGEWLLFLHADSRLPAAWTAAVQAVMNTEASNERAWFFDFRVREAGPGLRLLELAVAIRSHLLQRPYGDQGLLICRSLYEHIGGYAEIPLMEDLDLVERLSKQNRTKLKGLGLSLTTDDRRWRQEGLLNRTWQNALLRHRWRKGEKASRLSASYYP